MKNIKWLFFDIGSTLVDESIAYRKRIETTVADTDISYDEFYRKMVEVSKQNQDAYNSAVAVYGLNKVPWNSDDEIVYPEAEECLRELSKRYKIGIIANQNPGSRERLEKMGLLKYIDLVVASAEEGVAKPDLPEEAVMVGDRIDNDIIPAKKLGMKTVWIKQGFGKYYKPNSAEDKPDWTINTLNEVTDLFLEKYEVKNE